jgi:hypothetical protein
MVQTKTKKQISIWFFMVLVLMAMAGCVGTVEEAAPPASNFYDPNKNGFNFPGITSATAIAHDRIEIEFYPAVVSGEVNYNLYINGDDDPVNLNLEALDSAPGGKLMYTLKGLSMNTQYKLKIRAFNPENFAKSENENEMFVTTFDNQTATFGGINEAIKVVGQGDKSIDISWIQAQMDGLFVATAYDPVYYEVTYISDVGGPKNINNPLYAGSDRKVVRVPPAPTLISPSAHPDNVRISNLQPSTTYYFQVRAINKLYEDYLQDPNYDENTIPVDKELNSRYLKITTDSSTSLFDFDKDGVVLQNALGDQAFNNIGVFWTPGEGAFNKYRVYYKKYSGLPADAEIDDELTDVTLLAMEAVSNYVDVNSEDTNLPIGSLDQYEWYQVKVVLCKTAACPVDPLDPDYGIVSDMKAIRTEPTLAPFSGITFVNHPTDAAALDEIRVQFDPPVLTLGYADNMKIFCLDPDDYGNYTQFSPVPGVQIADGSPVANCNGLTLMDTLDLDDYDIKVKGVNNINSSPLNLATYCFAIAPAISFKPEPIDLPPANWIVRCISPEIRVPNISEFPGITSNCIVNDTDATVNWTPPAGGIYNKYELWYREIQGGDSFKYGDALGADPDYTSSGFLPQATTNYTINNLRPGKKYAVGILSVADDGAAQVYSEFNLGIAECEIPMPQATFKEWTRIYALGPKIDGRFPMLDANTFRPDAHILEAVTNDAIPYEVEIDPVTTFVVDASYRIAPGHYPVEPTTYLDVVDGKPNASSYFASNQGIISIAWEDVDLDFLGTEFTTNQDNGVRGSRDYGYRIYRSDDNRVSWTEVSDVSGLIHANDYNFRPRPNATVVTKRMGFFTDYSVKYSPQQNNISHARVYWYKIVPVFEGAELNYIDSRFIPHNMVKVTLPPPNMALMHRWMANRHMCMEMNKIYDTDEGAHYRCDYNGIGSSAKIIPWQIGESVYDVGADFLIDRFELGCQYTRGDFVADSTQGLSFFDKPSDDPGGSQEDIYDFRGYPTDTFESEDESVAFKGCINDDARSDARRDDTTALTDYPDYKRVIHGDCLGSNTVTIPLNECPDPTVYNGSHTYVFPGARLEGGAGAPNYDCSNNTNPNEPQVVTSGNPDPNYSRMSTQFRRNLVTQSEFLAVFYNRNSGTGRYLNPVGPNGGIITKGQSSNNTRFACNINIASIGETTRDLSKSDAWRARWFPTNTLEQIKSNGVNDTDILQKTVGDILADTSFYDGVNYKAPSGFHLISNRYDLTTPIAKIFSSNSAKLPPLDSHNRVAAQSICGAHKVQVGIANDIGGWLGMEAPKGKRIPRRKEFVVAAAWPTSADNSVSDDWDYDDTFIQDLETGTNSTAGMRSCNDAGKTDGATSKDVDSPLGIRAYYDNGGNPSSPIPGGTSLEDVSDGDATETCVSKWGVQDLVGNMEEPIADTMTCDYSKDQIYFGQFTGDPVPIGGGIGQTANSVPYTPPWGTGNTVYIRADAEITFANGDPAINLANNGAANMAWARIDPDSGYCSYVDNDSTRVADPSNFREPSGVFKEIFNPDGSLSDVLEIANPIDQDAVDDTRNGDGFFMNWGQNNLGPQFSLSNKFKISTAGGGTGPYFNPVLGFPLSCGLASCDTFASDNKLVTTVDFDGSFAPVEPLIRDFPTGNSEISNTGISSYVFYGGAKYAPYTIPAQTGTSVTIIEGFEVQGDGSDMSNFTVQSSPVSNYVLDTVNYGPGYVLSVTQAQWSLARGTYLYFPSGGSFTDGDAGRYTTIVRGRPGNWYGPSDQGIRCLVKVNEND